MYFIGYCFLRLFACGFLFRLDLVLSDTHFIDGRMVRFFLDLFLFQLSLRLISLILLVGVCIYLIFGCRDDLF